jgi:hypothetical protein
MEECKKQARNLRKDGKPKKWYYAMPIIIIYLLIIFMVIKNIFLRIKINRIKNFKYNIIKIFRIKLFDKIT